ncbi:hypothetical protein HS088_TW20G00629 [Tripterygium wilfordii]|uniref:Nucleotide-diphospho-sugar transferase domain-containing protein n=1 Tax=Tripterygium wilfordii TaxID=458696 RepID=A0A7J7C937_TRIWF|nr:uncharacterized protein At4g15970-like [Tripterygium wilfordii]KAF5730256.1 hypothetical protein HS088_TW20G00629 [Tripterygium wilfordii]
MTGSIDVINGGDEKPSSTVTTAKQGWSMSTGKPFARIALLFVGVGLFSCLVLYMSADPFRFLPSFYYEDPPVDFLAQTERSPVKMDNELKRVLENATTEDKTVIITTLNEAWAEPESILDVFLESFRVGDGTSKLVKHLVIVCLDQKAYSRCREIHPHCYALKTEGADFSGEAYFMTPDYLEMMWRRIDLLTNVLAMGYSFVFTDADIMWLRDPFKHFYPATDFQIASDFFTGDPHSLRNSPNGGFNFVRSNYRTMIFYKFWYYSRTKYPGLHDQDVLNRIKYHPFITEKIGLKIMFLDTDYFGGFCQPSKDFNKVCTMHANCCLGLDNKVHDLKIVVQDWKQFQSLTPDEKSLRSEAKWGVPQHCSMSYHLPEKKIKDEQQH